MKYKMILLCGLVILAGCKERTVPFNGTIMFTSGHRDIELIPNKIVELGGFEEIGPNYGSIVRATAKLSDDRIIIETSSSINEFHKVSTNVIVIGNLPAKVSGQWGSGQIHIKDAK